MIHNIPITGAPYGNTLRGRKWYIWWCSERVGKTTLQRSWKAHEAEYEHGPEMWWAFQRLYVCGTWSRTRLGKTGSVVLVKEMVQSQSSGVLQRTAGFCSRSKRTWKKGWMQEAGWRWNAAFFPMQQNRKQPGNHRNKCLRWTPIKINKINISTCKKKDLDNKIMLPWTCSG